MHPGNTPAVPLAALFAAMFAAAAGTHALTPLFPELKGALGLEDASVRSLGAVYTVAHACSALLLGALCDRLGRRRVLVGSLLCYSAASALLLAPATRLGFSGFLALRTVAGCGSGGIAAAAVALTSDLVTFARRGRAMSFVLAGAPAAVVLGIPLACLLARWRLTAIFGFLALVAGAACIMLARGAPRGLPAAAGPARTPPWRVLAARGAGAALAVTFLVDLGAFAVLTSLADHCAERFGTGLSARGLFFFGLGLAALGGALLAGFVSDRLGKRRSVLAALLGTAALAPLLLVPRSFPGFVAAALAVSLVQALRPGPFVAILTELAEPRLRGSLAGLNSMAAGLGLAAGTWLGGAVFAQHGLRGGVLLAVAAVLLAALLFGLLVARRQDARVRSV